MFTPPTTVRWPYTFTSSRAEMTARLSAPTGAEAACAAGAEAGFAGTEACATGVGDFGSGAGVAGGVLTGWT